MAGAKQLINRSIRQIAGLRICSVRPRGRFFYEDVRDYLTENPFCIDAGANRGQWCLDSLKELPRLGRIHCFEPMPEEFRQLQAATQGFEQVECHKLALGDFSGSAEFFVGLHHTTHSLIKQYEGQSCIQVEVVRLDEFCSSRGIESIGLLKIDTEGNELKVLKGAEKLLGGGRIGLVLAEAFFDPTVQLTLFDDLRSFLDPFGYKLFGVYDQQPHWDGRPAILYPNVCFIHQPG